MMLELIIMNLANKTNENKNYSFENERNLMVVFKTLSNKTRAWQTIYFVIFFLTLIETVLCLTKFLLLHFKEIGDLFKNRNLYENKTFIQK